MLILDGAHNGEGIRALTGEMRALLGEKKAKILFASMADKDWPLMLGELSAVAGEIMLTRVAMERSADPAKMAASVREVPVAIEEDSRQGLRRLWEKSAPDDVILVAGSLYLLGEVRPLALELAASARENQTDDSPGTNPR
jgi:dihydrofolate synthase/folylpolyglutamate synthase